MPNKLTINNGKELRKWGIFAVTIIGILIVGITGWNSLEGQVAENQKEVSRVCDDLKALSKNLHINGTTVSQQNRRDIIALKKDVQYTAAMVRRIADKLGVE